MTIEEYLDTFIRPGVSYGIEDLASRCEQALGVDPADAVAFFFNSSLYNVSEVLEVSKMEIVTRVVRVW